MAAHLPPVPPDQRSHKGGDASAHDPASDKVPEVGPPPDPNLAEQGERGNMRQNTSNKGYQQDR